MLKIKQNIIYVEKLAGRSKFSVLEVPYDWERGYKKTTCETVALMEFVVDF